MKILIIQQKRIGDVLTSSILCNNLKKKYPDSIIDFMCYPNCVDVLKENPNIDNIIELSNKVRKSYPSLFQFIFKIRQKKYNVVIDIYNKLESNLITLFSGAKFKISYYKWYSFLFYNHNLMRFDGKKSPEYGFAIDNRLLLLKPLIKEKITDIKPKLFLTEAEKKEAEKTLKSYGIVNGNRPLIMINILGSEEFKTYPLDKMAKIIDFVVAKTDANIIFNYIPNQKNEALAVYNFCAEKTRKNIYFDLYCESLRKFLALLSLCDVLIGNEGGAVNMAKALEIPTFSLFSPSIDKETWQLFEDEKKHASIHLKDLKPDIYHQNSYQFIRENTLKYYDEYPLNELLNKLETYLMDNNIKIISRI
ncbi:MAG: glycosyltransferase family 9 protein [Lentimicrobium sp.]|jgi:heptosyltransferase-2|nr:glycosyltransferase family 9 protein [Lentimicrobium sp.]